MMKRRPSHWVCPECSSNLDHGERCDCDFRANVKEYQEAIEYGATHRISLDEARKQIELERGNKE